MSKKGAKSKSKRKAANARSKKRNARTQLTAALKHKRQEKLRDKKLNEKRKFQQEIEKILASRKES